MKNNEKFNRFFISLIWSQQYFRISFYNTQHSGMESELLGRHVSMGPRHPSAKSLRIKKELQIGKKLIF